MAISDTTAPVVLCRRRGHVCALPPLRRVLGVSCVRGRQPSARRERDGSILRASSRLLSGMFFCSRFWLLGSYETAIQLKLKKSNTFFPVAALNSVVSVGGLRKTRAQNPSEQRSKPPKSKLDMGWHNRGCPRQKRGVRKLM